MVNMVCDDDAANIAANDMVQAVAANAPYTKSWLPVFNGPWAVLAGFPPSDPVGNLSRYDGTSTLGTWTIAGSDQFALDTGTLNAWSILVTPVHFTCAAFAPVSLLSATKTVAGTFRIGDTVTYTVTITNNGTDNQGNNPGNEFTDVLPAGLTLVSATAPSGTTLATIGTNTVTWNGSLAPLGGSVTITITATINVGAQGTTISNQGSLSFDGNNDNVNEASGVTDDPGVVGATNQTNFQVADGPAIPTGLTATATTATNVNLSWSSSLGATQYEIVRASASSGYATLITTTGTSYADGSVGAGATYVYKVRAIDSSAHSSPFSTPDAATTMFFTDDPLIANATIIKAVHITELRQAVNLMRAAASLGAASFTDPVLTGGALTKAVHLQEVRTALSQARVTLGLSTIGVTDAILTGGTTVVKAAHVQELRNGVK